MPSNAPFLVQMCTRTGAALKLPPLEVGQDGLLRRPQSTLALIDELIVADDPARSALDTFVTKVQDETQDPDLVRGHRSGESLSTDLRTILPDPDTIRFLRERF